jgi:hypothetical protein
MQRKKLIGSGIIDASTIKIANVALKVTTSKMK